MAKRKLRTLDEIDEEYFQKHPEEIEGYRKVCFEEYAKDLCTPGLTVIFTDDCPCERHYHDSGRSRDDAQWCSKGTVRRRQPSI